MDRRVVVGLVGFALMSIDRACLAQTSPGRDPSAQPSVGLVPIPSIGDTINGASGFPRVAPPASTSVPVSPVGLGPTATIPAPPVLPGPVSLTPMDPIQQSLTRGMGTSHLGSFFRRPARASRPLAGARTVAPAMPPRYAPPNPTPPETAGASEGRPSPYAEQRPELPRPQAEPAEATAQPRPAPYSEERPGSGRPRSRSANTPAYRPVGLPPPPPLEPVAPAPAPLPEVAPPPVGSDPMAGLPLEPARQPDPLPSPPTVVADPKILRTSQDATAVRVKPLDRSRNLPSSTIRAAAVGDEIITINELTTAVNDRLREMLGVQQAQMSSSELYEIKNRVAASVLNGLIDQCLILQAANSKMKNSKARQAFDDFLDKKWKDDELPPLLRKYSAVNVHELKVKLTAEGKSYDSMKESFRRKVLAREFLGNEIRNKVTSDVPELKAYYGDHLDQFEQPARITWREIEINVGRYPNRAAARQKADEALARLLRDESFDVVARTSSNGPTASKGGLYVDMQPGSYGIPAVNDELNRLPVGQVSQVLEAPGSFFIVRVDSRREKGPLRFDEVQDKIRSVVLEQNFQKAVEDYLAKLRTRTLIRTMFDNTESDPEIARRNDAAVRQAAGR